MFDLFTKSSQKIKNVVSNLTESEKLRSEREKTLKEFEETTAKIKTMPPVQKSKAKPKPAETKSEPKTKSEAKPKKDKPKVAKSKSEPKKEKTVKENTKPMNNDKIEKNLDDAKWNFSLRPEITQSIAELGYESPTKIQQTAIPLVQSGVDIIGQAQTGSGKTAAFVIPAVNKIKSKEGIQVLVLVPTRELALQVTEEFYKIGKHSGVKLAKVVGGESYNKQLNDLSVCSVVVATPGRLLDLLESGRIKKFKPSLVVVDEADEMLDMGFITDIKKILAFTPDHRQTLLFSATMPQPVVKLAKDHMKNPEHVALNHVTDNHIDIEQIMYAVRPREKELALVRILASENFEKAIVFCRTRSDTADLFESLSKSGLKAVTLQGDLSQHDRRRAISAIKNDSADILVATDIASRGLDIANLSHVINYHIPENLERYTHRIGRTGRAGNKGKAITIATPSDVKGGGFLVKLIKDKKINLKAVPNRSHVESQKALSLQETIKNLESTDEGVAFYNKMLESIEGKELLEKLCSYVISSHTVAGPDDLGLKVRDVVKMAESSGFRGGGGRSSGGSYRRGGRSRSSSPRHGRGGRSGPPSQGRSRGPRSDRFKDSAGSGGGPKKHRKFSRLKTKK